MGLNQKQKEAVEYLDGPLLVLAGPGTGKTQLLSEKVIYILENTDTAPENILCLTFTESGARNMRERLSSLIGKDALKVNIGTYHAFGQEILARYKNFSPEYTRILDQAIDEVAQFKIIKDLQSKLPARDILRGDKVSDIISTISSAKTAGLTASDLEKIALQNAEDSEVLSSAISPLLSNVVPRVFKASYENAYRPIYEILKDYENLPPIVGRVERLIVGMARDLKAAISDAEDSQKITPLTHFKDTYFEKNDTGGYRLSDRVANLKLKSLANIMKQYQAYLEDNGLYDFDDMIIEAARALREDLSFKQTLQEKYQYIMLDEFQDTNPAQLSIIKELTDYEKPMVMAVGDDDQAIYEFQGANASNLLDFREYYSAHMVVLTENYRSTQEILDFSREIIKQAPNRLVSDKNLTSHQKASEKTQIFRKEFVASDQEYAFVADKISELISSGVKQTDIAIISSKHKYFQPLLPYLKEKPEIKIAYERRDNLLDDARIHEMVTIMKMATEIALEKRTTVPMLEVLTYPWLNVPVMEVVKLVREARDAHRPVFEYLLDAKKGEELSAAVEFIAELSTKALDTPIETIFSDFTKRMRVEEYEPFEMFSYYENLASLRAKLIKYAGEKSLKTVDLVQMIEDYTEAGLQITATSPYKDADEAVQVLSAHKAKGLEFSYVFIISADHTAWGKGKGNNNFLALPSNLIQIRHTGTTDSEQIRLLYVACTRAKRTLYITSSIADFNGKSPDRLEYLDDNVETVELGDDRANMSAVKRLKDYLTPFVANSPDMRSIYKERVKNYRLSASDLTSFIDIANAGPKEFFEKKILGAESEPEDETLAMGNLIHLTFEQVTNSGISDEAAKEFYLDELEKRDLPLEAKENIRKIGPIELEIALEKFSKILRSGKAEVNLAPEKIVVGGVPVTGKIDHIATSEENKTIEIYDFKTGKYHKDKWGSHPTLYKYMLQLLFYKMLLNNSPIYKKYKVEKAHILFVKPDENNDNQVYDKIYEFNTDDETEFMELIQAVYSQIHNLRFLDDPDVFIDASKTYGIKKIREFIELLLAKSKD